MHRTRVAERVIARLIEEVVPFGIVMSRLHLHILKINKNDQTLSLTYDANAVATRCTSHTCKRRFSSSHYILSLGKALQTSLVALCRKLGSKAGNALHLSLMSCKKSLLLQRTSLCVMRHLCRSTQHTVISHVRITISLVCVHGYRHTVFGRHKVEVLVATHHDSNHTAIGLAHLCLTALCRYSPNGNSTEQGNENSDVSIMLHGD